ncbi:MAG: adenylate kinase [Candidatus Limnocylindrales bacterium]
MVGAPGAGKGTQAALLAQRLGVPHVASGDLFRDNIKRETALGKKVKKFIDAGALVPDDVTVQMISQRLREPDAKEGAILDGFPRTRPQAEALDKMLGKVSGRVAAALYIDVERDQLIKRLSGRWLCTKSSDHVYHETARPPKKKGVCDLDGAALYQREDDKPETIRARLEQQLPPMYEVIDYYTDRGVLATVDGARPMGEVTEDLMHCISSARKTAASDRQAPAVTTGADRFVRSGGGTSDACKPAKRRNATASRAAGVEPAKETSMRGGAA